AGPARAALHGGNRIADWGAVRHGSSPKRICHCTGVLAAARWKRGRDAVPATVRKEPGGGASGPVRSAVERRRPFHPPLIESPTPRSGFQKGPRFTRHSRSVTQRV